MLIAGCGGGSTASTAASSAAPATAAPASEAPASAGSDSAALSDAVNAKSVEYFLASCAQAPEPAIGTPDAESASCTIVVSPAFVSSALAAVCVASEDGEVLASLDEESGSCELSPASDDQADADAVNAGCGLIMLDEASYVSANFVDAETATCAISFDPVAALTGVCAGVPASAEPLLDEEAGSCNLTSTPAYIEETLGKAIAEGKVTCADGSPATMPSDDCLLAYLDEKIAALYTHRPARPTELPPPISAVGASWDGISETLG